MAAPITLLDKTENSLGIFPPSCYFLTFLVEKKELNQEEQEGQEVLRKKNPGFHFFSSCYFLTFLVEEKNLTRKSRKGRKF